MLDFPSSPTVGQKYPSPPIVGVPVYTWDGAKWIAVGSGVATVIVSDTPPIGVADDTLWWESDTGLLYFRYNDGNSTQWVIACPQPDISTFVPSAGGTMSGPLILSADPAASLGAATKQYVDTRVRYDAAQALTADSGVVMGQRAQARTNIYAAPFDALAYNGIQINGSMEVSQELGSAGTAVNGAYFCDGWRSFYSGTMVVGAVQSSANVFSGFSSYISLAMNTPQATINAGDYACIAHYIEGWRCARLGWGAAGAQPLTIGFWTAHNKPGVYGGSVRNGANNRSCAFAYTHNVASAAQFNVVTIPGDTAGTWKTDNTIGLMLTLAAACGSTFTAPAANAWFASNFLSAPGQINGVTSGSVLIFSGVIVLPGLEAPSAARSPFIMRPYDQELVLCQRYLQYMSPVSGLGLATASFFVGHMVCWPTPMRAAPTISFPTPPTYNGNCSSITGDNATPTGCRLYVSTPASGGYDFNGGVMKLDARL